MKQFQNCSSLDILQRTERERECSHGAEVHSLQKVLIVLSLPKPLRLMLQSHRKKRRYLLRVLVVLLLLVVSQQKFDFRRV